MKNIIKFCNAAREAGYTVDNTNGFWLDQFNEYINGNRGPDMHDFTLVWMSANYTE